MRDAGPEEVEALKGERSEAGGVRADPGFGELGALVDVGELTELNVEAVLRVLLWQADEDSVAEAVGSGAIAAVELGSEVGAHWDEGVEGAPVAPGPWGDAGEEEQAREAGVGEG